MISSSMKRRFQSDSESSSSYENYKGEQKDYCPVCEIKLTQEEI